MKPTQVKTLFFCVCGRFRGCFVGAEPQTKHRGCCALGEAAESGEKQSLLIWKRKCQVLWQHGIPSYWLWGAGPPVGSPPHG